MSSVSFLKWAALGWAALAIATEALGQPATPRIRIQDPKLNNLGDPPGYKTAPAGTLGAVARSGPADAPPLILVPGFGFGAAAYAGLAEKLAMNHRVFVVTLPGFGGTPAPASPPETTSLGEQTWTVGAVEAIEKLIRDEGMKDPVVIGHWIGGTQIALRLALRNPQAIRAVVLLAGSARMIVQDPRSEEFYGTLERRVSTMDKFMAPRWFKTVTRETWDDNNFLPGDYSANPVLGLRLWRMAAEPPLHVWVRYLCEFNAQDINLDLPRLSVPTLLLKPRAEDLPKSPDTDYLQGFLHTSWEGRAAGNAMTIQTIPNSRVFIWVDQPDLVEEALKTFIARTRGPRPGGTS